MSEPNTDPGAGGGTPSPAPPAPPSPTPAPSPPAPPAVTMTSEQLKSRLDETRTAARAGLLKELGVEKLEDVSGALAEYKKLREATMSEAEKATARVKELEPFAERAASLESSLKSLVDEQFAAMPEAAQKAIDEVADGDPEIRLNLMQVMRKAGGGVSAPPAPPAPPGPANAGPGAPPAPSGQPSKFDQWQAQEKRHPLAGAIFYDNHKREIEASRPAAA